MNISIKQLQRVYDLLEEIPEPMINELFVDDFKKTKKILKDIINSNKQVTFTEAAKILDVSYAYLEKLLEEGKITSTGRCVCKNVSLKDLLDYKEKRDKIRHEKLQELTDLSQELGLYDG